MCVLVVRYDYKTHTLGATPPHPYNPVCRCDMVAALNVSRYEVRVYPPVGHPGSTARSPTRRSAEWRPGSACHTRWHLSHSNALCLVCGAERGLVRTAIKCPNWVKQIIVCHPTDVVSTGGLESPLCVR